MDFVSVSLYVSSLQLVNVLRLIFFGGGILYYKSVPNLSVVIDDAR